VFTDVQLMQSNQMKRRY